VSPFLRALTVALALFAASAALWAAAATAHAAGGPSSHIAFVKREAGAKYSHIWTIAPDGRGLKKLTNAQSHDLAPAWSPGRGTIAFLRSKSGSIFDRRARLMLMRSDGSNERQFAYGGPSLTTGATALAYSPNGRYLAGGAFLRNSYGDYNDLRLTVLDLKAKRSRAIVRLSGMNGIISLSWSPDSRQIAVTTEHGDGYSLFRVDVGKGKRLSAHVGLHESVSWRPDGAYLLCTTWHPEEVGYPHRTELVTPRGGFVATLGEDQRWAVYAPSGDRYAFLQNVRWDDPPSLRIASGDGSGEQVVYTGERGEQLDSPGWR
jgi:WD40 repeat protein